MKYLIWFILVFAIRIEPAVFGQQIPILQSEQFTPAWQNPASFGTWNKASANLTVAGNFPNDIVDSHVLFLNGEFRIGDPAVVNFGTGINAYFEEVGFSRVITSALNVNVQFKLNKVRLSIGVSPGVKNFANVAPAWTDTLDPNLPPTGNVTKFSLGAGLMVYTEHLYAGLSAVQLTQPTYDELQYTDAVHFSIHGGYRHMVNRNWGIFPSIQCYSDGAVMLAQGQFLFYITKPRLFTGMGYGSSFHPQFIIGHHYRSFQLLYSLGVDLQAAFASNVLRHEIRLSFRKPAKFDCSTCPDW